MRSFIEKLAKLVETEGKQIGRCLYKIQCYEIYAIPGDDMSYLNIINEISKETTTIKLYEEESDLLKKALERCKEKTTDSIIKQINNL
jgi:CO dehydrogenase/acetyl-CoA synthase gamma subunit (corrinoid Fe-S protein)